MDRMTITEYKSQKRNKYHAKPTIVDGQRFDSKLESERYRELKNLWQMGAISWFTRQVPFQLPGGIVYRADFLVVSNHGEAQEVRVEDCKGFMSPVSKLKIAQVESIYGIKIDIITRGTTHGFQSRR